MDDWLNEIAQIRVEDAAKRQDELGALNLSLLKRPRPTGLLNQSKAHDLLRQVQKALLGGKGVIDQFDRTKQYDRAISLVWQGPVSAPRNPRATDPEEYQYILIGVKNGKLYVNGKHVEANPDDLKSALVKAAKDPGKTARAIIDGKQKSK